VSEPVEIAPGITIDTEVRHGKPVIKGTRVPVSLVLGQLSAGVTHAEIEAEYGVTEEGIKAALLYATELVSQETVRAR
jgi:uncharacterized protein (DUF433 family)